MDIWPAIDLLGGKCVRLQQGDYHRETVFSDSPGKTASQWFSEGANRLHCVDLDAAKTGSIVNEAAIREIVSAAEGRPIQLGGGVRDEAAIERLLRLGVSRLVAGTAALKNPKWFAEMCHKYPGTMVLGVDAKNGMVATQGWLDVSNTSALELIQQVSELTDGCVGVVYTDIAKDGMLEGPNWESLAEIRSRSPFPVVASGGVTSLDDIRRLTAEGTHAAIVGRALYEGRMSLREAIQIAES